MQAHSEGGGGEDPRLTHFRQRKRQVQCAMNLANKLQKYIDLQGDEAAYKEEMLTEAKELSSSALGSTLLRTIGKAYLLAARKESGTLDSFSVDVEKNVRGVGSRLSMASSGIQAALKAREVSLMQESLKKQAAAAASITATPEEVHTVPTVPVHEEELLSPQDNNNTVPSTVPSTAVPPHVQDVPSQRNSLYEYPKKKPEKVYTEEDLTKKIEDMSSHMISVMWHVTEIDIRMTLAKVCIKVCHDHSVNEAVRSQRLHALKALGEVYLSCGGPLDKGISEMIGKVKEMQSGGKASSSSSSSVDSHEEEAEVKAHHAAEAHAYTYEPQHPPAVATSPSKTEDNSNNENVDLD